MAKPTLSLKEPQITVLLDTDVLINWLIEEFETATNRKLWEMPHRIISLIESKKLRGATSLTTLLEIRFLLRRKKGCDEQEIEGFINDITSIIEVAIPDEISLLEANKLQSEYPLDPFDAISLGLAVILKPSAFVSRDSRFLKISSGFLTALTPEELIDKLPSNF